MGHEAKEYFNKAALKEKGWTDRLVKIFLPEPDLEKINPIYKSASPQKLYLQSRVEEIENSTKFKCELEKSKKRKVSSKKAVETKEQKLFREIKNFKRPNLPEISKNKLIEKAILHYNIIHFESGKFACMSDDKEFLDRISVNFIRHEVSNYEEQLNFIFGKVGKNKAYALIKEKILRTIAEKYPWLSDECESQIWRLKAVEDVLEEL